MATAAVVLVGKSVLGTALGKLYDEVKKAKDKAMNFKPTLERIEKTIDLIRREIEMIEELNEKLDRGKEDTEKFVEQIERGEQLVVECSNIRWYMFWRKLHYTHELTEFENSLNQFCGIVVPVRLIKEILLARLDLKRLARRGKVPSLIEFKAPCSASKPPKFTVGLDVPLNKLKQELFKDGVSMVVLTAPPGCGKTTLTKLFCHDEQVQEKFKQNIFFTVVSKNPTIEGIIQRLLQHTDYEVPDFERDEDAACLLNQLLKTIGEPILLVLDDIGAESESLLEKIQFQISDYKILVTSRYEFRRFGPPHKLEPLNDEDSMALFRNSAVPLGRTCDIPDEDMMKKIVERCKGFPLALTVVGSSLCGKDAETWKITEMELSKNPLTLKYSNLHRRLQTSLDALDNNLVDFFMDLCSFPEDQSIPVTALRDMWAELYELDEDGVTAVSRLHELSNRNLIDLVVTGKDVSGSYNQHFVMQHDLLRELAIHHSSLESVERRKRLILEVRGSSVPDCWIQQKQTILGLLRSVAPCLFWWMNENQPIFNGHLLSISTDAKFPPEQCTMKAPAAEVLVLNIRKKNYSLPEFIQEMQRLKVLILTNYSFFPTELSNFQVLRSASNLKRIRLEKVSVPSSAFTSAQLKNLKTIRLVMCNIGKAFSTSKLQVQDALPNVVEVNIDYCNDMKSLPVELCQLKPLKKLGVTDCHDLTALPEEIGNLENIEVLRLTSCIELTGLPRAMGKLQKLSILDITECPEIERLPEEFGGLQNLRKLYMTGCSKVCELPRSIGNLNLEEVTCDEEVARLWKSFLRSSAKIKVPKEEHDLKWLRN